MLFVRLWSSLCFARKTEKPGIHCRYLSHRRCSVKKGVLRKFAKFTGKTCARGSFLIKLQALGFSPATLLKKESVTRLLSCEFYEISKNTFFTEHLRTTASVNGQR